MTERKDASREDDFRDYEQRDIRDGWPYSDKDGDRNALPNAPYGTSDANLDQLDDKGVEVADDPAERDVDGAPLPFSDDAEDVLSDDDLEERITQLLEDDERVDLASLDITIRNGVAHLDGAVDSEEDRRHLVSVVRRLKGVRDVRAADLRTRGVDSHIPRDADE
jgi:hypothetical protein